MSKPKLTTAMATEMVLQIEALQEQIDAIYSKATMRAQLAEPVMTEFGPGIGIRADCSRETTAPLALLDCILQALISQSEKIKEPT